MGKRESSKQTIKIASKKLKELIALGKQVEAARLEAEEQEREQAKKALEINPEEYSDSDSDSDESYVSDIVEDLNESAFEETDATYAETETEVEEPRRMGKGNSRCKVKQVAKPKKAKGVRKPRLTKEDIDALLQSKLDALAKQHEEKLNGLMKNLEVSAQQGRFGRALNKVILKTD